MEVKTAKIALVWVTPLAETTRPVMAASLRLAAGFPAVLFALRRPNAVPAARVVSWGSLPGWSLVVWWESPLPAATVDSEISTLVPFSEPRPTEPPRRPIEHGERLLHYLVDWTFVGWVPMD